jgi:prepilin-type processing-associated H-X9-DG protein
MMIRRGLTLIEILVVAAVLILLLALIVPTLKSSKESGISILCGSNLKQIYLITEIYIQDNLRFPQGFCGLSNCLLSPPKGGCPGNRTYDWPGWWWFNYLGIEDLSEKGILWCPARRRMSSPFRDDLLWSNYGINYSIAKWASENTEDKFRGPPLGKDQIPKPSKTLLYVDSGYALISWKAAAENMDPRFDNNPLREDSFYLPGLDLNKDRPIHLQQQEDAVRGRHPKQTVQVGYADGHVRKEKAERLLFNPDEEENPSPLYLWSAGR